MTDLEMDLLIANARIKALEAQLAASKRREQAAVKDLEYVCFPSEDRFEVRSICDICKHKKADGTCDRQCEINTLAAKNRWEWRGPQDAKKQPVFYNCPACGCVVSDLISACPKCGRELRGPEAGKEKNNEI